MSWPPQPKQKLEHSSTAPQDACQLRNSSVFLGHSQPPTPIQTNNTFAKGIANKTTKQTKQPKATARMHSHGCDAEAINNSSTHFAQASKGSKNRADQFTEHHRPCFPPLKHAWHLLVHTKSLITHQICDWSTVRVCDVDGTLSMPVDCILFDAGWDSSIAVGVTSTPTN